MVSHAGSPGQVPEVQFRRGLGHSNSPAMAVDGRFTGSWFVRKLLQAKAHAASKPSLARATESLAEHAFAYTLLNCMNDEEHVRHGTILPLRAHDRRAHAVRPMFISLMPTAGAGRCSAHELRARPATSVHFPGRIPVRAAPRVRMRDDGFRLPG